MDKLLEEAAVKNVLPSENESSLKGKNWLVPFGAKFLREQNSFLITKTHLYNFDPL